MMMAALVSVSAGVGLGCAMYFLFWLGCRIPAHRCPNPKCRSRWQTHLLAEWDHHETWGCCHCGHYWDVRIPPPPPGGQTDA